MTDASECNVLLGQEFRGFLAGHGPQKLRNEELKLSQETLQTSIVELLNLKLVLR